MYLFDFDRIRKKTFCPFLLSPFFLDPILKQPLNLMMNQMLMRKVYLFAIGKINSQTEKTYLIWNRINENKMSLKSQRKTKTNNSISTKTTLNYHCYYYYKNKKKLEEKKKIVISTLLTTTSLSFNVISYSLLLSALCFCIISTEKTNYIPYCLSINIILLNCVFIHVLASYKQIHYWP